MLGGSWGSEIRWVPAGRDALRTACRRTRALHLAVAGRVVESVRLEDLAATYSPAP